MCMHLVKIVGEYKLKLHLSYNMFLCYFIKDKNKKYALSLGFELGIAWSPFFSVTICDIDLTDFSYDFSR